MWYTFDSASSSLPYMGEERQSDVHHGEMFIKFRRLWRIAMILLEAFFWKVEMYCKIGFISSKSNCYK
jgi:hypothetical protein